MEGIEILKTLHNLGFLRIKEWTEGYEEVTIVIETPVFRLQHYREAFNAWGFEIVDVWAEENDGELYIEIELRRVGE